MPYQKLIEYLAKINPHVLEAIEVASKIKSNAMRQTFESGISDSFPFDANTWDVFWKNTVRMKDVVRKTGLPYATHPTKMALIIYHALGVNEQSHDAAKAALLHDYLEEGDGFTPESYQKLKKDIPHSADACLGAVLLSEPVIDYDLFEAPQRMMEHVAYVKQIQVSSQHLKKLHYNAVIADKIDNGHDWEYITEDKHLTDASKRKRLLVRLGYMRFIYNSVAHLADEVLADLLLKTIENQQKNFEISSDELDIVIWRLHTLLDKYSNELSEQIQFYHDRLKLWS